MNDKFSSQESRNCNFIYKGWNVEFSRKDEMFYFSKDYMSTKIIINHKIDFNVLFERYYYTTSLDFFDYFTMKSFDCIRNSGLLTTGFIKKNLFSYSVELLIILNFFLEAQFSNAFFYFARMNDMEILKVWKDVFYEDMSFEEILAQVLVIFQ